MLPLAPLPPSDPSACWRDVTTAVTVVHGLIQLLRHDMRRLGTMPPAEQARLRDRLQRLQAASTTLTQRLATYESARAAASALPAGGGAAAARPSLLKTAPDEGARRSEGARP